LDKSGGSRCTTDTGRRLVSLLIWLGDEAGEVVGDCSPLPSLLLAGRGGFLGLEVLPASPAVVLSLISLNLFVDSGTVCFEEASVVWLPLRKTRCLFDSVIEALVKVAARRGALPE